MSESAVALFRAAGFRARLVLPAHNPRRIQADHVMAEYYSESSGKFVMVDPTIGYRCGESVLTDAELSAELNRRHGLPITTNRPPPSSTAVARAARFFISPQARTAAISPRRCSFRSDVRVGGRYRAGPLRGMA